MEFRYESLPYRVVFGAGSSRTQLRGEVEHLGLSRLLLIAADAEAELAGELAEPLGSLVAERYSNVRPHVPDDVADDALHVAVGSGVDGLLTIGGGSTTGTAKIVALSTGLPIVAVPTTYAGSEMTPVWGRTSAAAKKTGTDPRVLPKSVIYDPDLVATLPRGLAVASGLNALAHCVEAHWTSMSDPVTRVLATEGVRSLSSGLRGLDDGRPEQARSELLYGAFLAGVSFASAGSGLHHKICHALGGRFDLPHAQTHAVVLPHVMAFNEPAIPDTIAGIVDALGVPAGDGGLHTLYGAIGAPRSLREVGLEDGQLEEAVAAVSRLLPIDNPREVTADDVAVILRHALDG